MKWFPILLLVKTVFSADQNPDENHGINDTNLFEGDMILTPKQRYRAEHGMDIDSDRKRASIRTGRLWPSGVVVYAVQSALSGNSRAWAAIRAGMSEWTTKTCISFRPRQNNEASYVYFTSGGSSVCSSYVGRTGRRQDITLGSRCWNRGVVAHEIGHAIGFLHEQSRPDRDNYVTIVWANIPSNRRKNFLKYGRSTIDSLGTPYDYGSVMHYGSKAFSRNGRPTILVKQNAVIGQRAGLSATDAQQANLLYKSLCPAGCYNYRNLTDFDREKDYRTPGNVAKCDRNLQKAWYRFTGAAGTQMPTQVVPINHCGTHATGWLSGGHPAVGQGAVQRRVCFHWAGRDRRRRRYDRPCMWSLNIRVENCGAFFVYELSPINRCSLRYCSDNLKAPTTLPTPAPTTPPSGCHNYINLTDFDREKDYRTPGNVAKCDRNLRKAWYRFTGAAGTQMPTQVVPINHCGTHATGWLSGGHPAVGQGTVQRKVCFHWAGRDRRRRRYDRPCLWSLNILVENCGAFFVYELSPINRCSLRYCSDDLKAPTTLPTPAPTTPPSGCHNYINLTDFDREKDYRTPGNVAKCDRNLQKAWYRFTGAAGTQMPTQVVPINHCGTHATGWLSGGHPVVGQGTVQRRVCFHWAGRDRRRRRYDRPCMWSLNVLVENCGAFFVYELSPINRCSLRYCSDNLKAPTTLPTPAPTTPSSAPTTPHIQAPTTIRTQATATTSSRVPPPMATSVPPPIATTVPPLIATTAICRDSSPSCSFFKSLNYCDLFPNIRDVLCKRSCNTC